MQVSLPCDLIRSGYPVKVTTIDPFAHVGIRERLSQSAPPRKKTHQKNDLQIVPKYGMVMVSGFETLSLAKYLGNCLST